MVKKAAMLMAILLCYFALLAAEKPVTVELDSLFSYSSDVSLQQARTKSLNAMRQKALEKTLPQDITLSSMINSMCLESGDKVNESIATSVFMNSSSSGRILKEKVILEQPDFDKKSQILRYRMKYYAEVMALKTYYNPAMELRVQLSQSTLKHDQQFTLQVMPNIDGYLYIFDFFSDNTVALVYPNLYLKDNYVKADQVWEQQLTAVADAKQDITIETLYFVFSTQPITGWENFKSNLSQEELVFSAGEESYTLFNKWLGKSDPTQRIEKMAQLHISK